MADRERNLHLVTEAGFAEVDAEELSGAMQAHDIDDYWDFQASISGPIAVLLADLPADEHDAIRAAFRSTAEPYRRGAGYELSFRAVIVHATR
jgi:hypothetical protein